MSPLAAGDVVRELDERGRLVQLWLVVAIHPELEGVRPGKVRAACRPRAVVEDWPKGRPWERSHHNHHFAMPPAS